MNTIQSLNLNFETMPEGFPWWFAGAFVLVLVHSIGLCCSRKTVTHPVYIVEESDGEEEFIPLSEQQ